MERQRLVAALWGLELTALGTREGRNSSTPMPTASQAHGPGPTVDRNMWRPKGKRKTGVQTNPRVAVSPSADPTAGLEALAFQKHMPLAHRSRFICHDN